MSEISKYIADKTKRADAAEMERKKLVEERDDAVEALAILGVQEEQPNV